MLPDFSELVQVEKFSRRLMHRLHYLIDLSPWSCRAREVPIQRHQARHMQRRLISHLHHLMTAGMLAVDMVHLHEARLIGPLRIGPMQATADLTRRKLLPDPSQAGGLTSQDMFYCLVAPRRRHVWRKSPMTDLAMGRGVLHC